MCSYLKYVFIFYMFLLWLCWISLVAFSMFFLQKKKKHGRILWLSCVCVFLHPLFFQKSYIFLICKFSAGVCTYSVSLFYLPLCRNIVNLFFHLFISCISFDCFFHPPFHTSFDINTFSPVCHEFPLPHCVLFIVNFEEKQQVSCVSSLSFFLLFICLVLRILFSMKRLHIWDNDTRIFLLPHFDLYLDHSLNLCIYTYTLKHRNYKAQSVPEIDLIFHDWNELFGTFSI